MKKTEKLPKEERPRFDYDKSWYLLPAQDQKVKKDFFGLELPGSINGKQLFGNCSFTSPLKIPVNKGCQVSLYEGDETGNLLAPESTLKRIKLEKDPKSSDKVYK